MMRVYEDMFGAAGMKCSQILLTFDNVSTPPHPAPPHASPFLFLSCLVFVPSLPPLPHTMSLAVQTSNQLATPGQYENAKNTFLALLEYGVVPIGESLLRFWA